MYKEIYSEELAHLTGRLGSPPAAICKPETREASGIIQFESDGLRIREADGLNPSPRTKEDM